MPSGFLLIARIGLLQLPRRLGTAAAAQPSVGRAHVGHPAGRASVGQVAGQVNTFLFDSIDETLAG